jgi:hypothetical protein
MIAARFAPFLLVLASSVALAATGDGECGRLVGATANPSTQGGFLLRTGEPVDFVSAGRTVHGTLLVYRDGDLYHAYWQPEGSPEKYALANADTTSVRLISTPAQGVPADNGAPGSTLAPQRVLSCPTF